MFYLLLDIFLVFKSDYNFLKFPWSPIGHLPKYLVLEKKALLGCSSAADGAPSEADLRIFLDLAKNA